MNNLVSFFLILFIPSLVFAQLDNYKSIEQDEYNKTHGYKSRIRPSKAEILSYRNDFFELAEIENFSPYSDSLYFTAYQDSICQLPYDSTIFWKTEYIGAIDRNFILKYEKKGKIEVFIYRSFKFDDWKFGQGVWVAISYDSGTSWEYLYTGIAQYQPVFVKWYSKLPLIISDTELQIEAALLRPSSEYFGVSQPHEAVKDNLVLRFDLDKLRKDTDLDNLTDIVERKLSLNPTSKDTDGDNIPDNLDLNPRFSMPRTDRTIIYEMAINDEFYRFYGRERDTIISSLTKPQINNVTNSTRTILIVTDDPAIQSMQPRITDEIAIRVIILSEKEYEQQKGMFRNNLKRVRVTPFLRVDGEKDTFIFEVDSTRLATKYLVKKIDGKWKIRVLWSLLNC